jgi:hypothetical protein
MILASNHLGMVMTPKAKTKQCGSIIFFVLQFVHPYFHPPHEWDFSTPHEHFKHREIKFLHKKWCRFVKMINDEDVEDYELVAGVRGQPKYTLLWLGER